MAEELKPPSTAPSKHHSLLGIGILLTIIVSVIGYFLYQTISPARAAVVVESDPVSIVYINGEQKGKTPFETEIAEDEITVKLVPESFTVPLSPYETNVKLAEGVKTIVRRNFGESEEEASGQIISFEKRSTKETSIAVVSDPDGVEVFIDGEKKGVTPLKVSTSSGPHTIRVTAGGYKENSFEFRAVNGYALTAIIELAKQLEAETEVLAKETATPVHMIKVSETSVGYLRVRAEADINSEEVGRVYPGDEFEVIDQDTEYNWYKIEFQVGEGEEVDTGWISGEFVSQIEEE